MTTTESRPTTFERTLGIRTGERVLVIWLVSLFVVVQASHGLGANSADALFFQRFGVDRLPLMILLSGPAVMIFILGHGSGLASRGAGRWLPTTTVLCAGWAGLEWAGAQFDSRLVYPFIWISTQVIIMVTLTVMWNAAGTSCTTRQAKRLFPIFATAGVAGGVLGNLLTGPLAALVGTANLLLVQASLLLVGTVLIRRMRWLFSTDDSEPPRSLLGELSETVTTIRSSRFLRLAALVAVALFCLFYLVYFPFSEAVATSFDTEAEMAGFLGVFSSAATAATFVFSLAITNRLFARFGVVFTLMIVPVVYAVGFGTWLIAFALTTAAAVRALQWVSVNAIALTAHNALFNVVTGRRRGQVVAFMTAVPAQIGVASAGAILIVTSSMPLRVVFAVGLVVSLISLLAVIVLRREYLTALVAAVRRGVVGIFDEPARAPFTPTDADSLRVLRLYLHDPRPGARAHAVAGLGRLEGADAADLEPFLGDADPRVRAAAFDSVCIVEPARVSTHAAQAIVDEVPEVRLHVLHYLAAHPEENGAGIARSALADPDVRVRAAAATIVGGEVGERIISDLLASGAPQAIAAALIEAAEATSPIAVDPRPFLDHDSPRVRAAATGAYARAGPDPAALRPGLDDRSPRVRRAAAAALGASLEGRAILVEVLASGSVTASEPALRALTPVDELAPDFTAWARAEAERAALLISYAQALETAEPSPALDYLRTVLDMRSNRLVQWVLLAMTTRETRAVMPLVAKGVRSSDPETKSQAIEALETIGAKEVLAVLLPHLEPDDAAASMSEEAALRALMTDFDPWLRSLATRAALGVGTGPGDGAPVVASSSIMESTEAQPILDTMDRVLVLQRVHMFSELDPEDLDLIARAATESSYEPEAPIYLEGQIGAEMLVIVEGNAVVSTSGASGRRHVQTYGAGEHVGELSLLAGGARSADVHAGDDGVRGLALSATDLLSVLEERPTVAVRMLATLARRLIEQT